MQCGGGVFTTRFDGSEPAQPPAQWAQEQRVVRQGVEGAVVAEGSVESGRKDEYVGCEHPAGVIGHDERPAHRRDIFHVPNLGAEPQFDQWL